jgi:ABC-2 type transport system ATP-binding protein
MGVVCEGIGRDYGPQVTALDDVTLTLASGVTGLVGVNGAGKSTLLRILAGALRPSRGSVRFGDLDPYGSGRHGFLRRTALMPQALEFPKDIRALDAVAYCGWLRRMSARAAKAAAADALEQVGLADRATHKLRSLSGGMQRRVALAQALVAAHDVLLLDEPTTGLDPEQRAGLRQLVSELPRDCVTVVSSHVMEDLESLADTIVVLEAGRLIYTGPLDTFRSDLGGPDRSAEHAFLSLLTSRRQAS